MELFQRQRVAAGGGGVAWVGGLLHRGRPPVQADKGSLARSEEGACKRARALTEGDAQVVQALGGPLRQVHQQRRQPRARPQLLSQQACRCARRGRGVGRVRTSGQVWGRVTGCRLAGHAAPRPPRARPRPCCCPPTAAHPGRPPRARWTSGCRRAPRRYRWRRYRRPPRPPTSHQQSLLRSTAAAGPARACRSCRRHQWGGGRGVGEA